MFIQTVSRKLKKMLYYEAKYSNYYLKYLWKLLWSFNYYVPFVFDVMSSPPIFLNGWKYFWCSLSSGVIMLAMPWGWGYWSDLSWLWTWVLCSRGICFKKTRQISGMAWSHFNDKSLLQQPLTFSNYTMCLGYKGSSEMCESVGNYTCVALTTLESG